MTSQSQFGHAALFGSQPVAKSAWQTIPVRLVSVSGEVWQNLWGLMELATRLVSRQEGLKNKLSDKGKDEKEPKKGSSIAPAGLAVSSLLGGLVTKGLQGTVEGAMLADQFTLLAREIANVFLPVVRQMTAHLALATNWLQNLGGQDQKKLMVGGLAVGSLGGVAALAPILGPFLGLLTSGLKPALGALMVAGGPVVWVIGGLAAGILALAAASQPVRDAFGPLVAAFQKVWEAQRPVRELLFQIAESAVVNFLSLFAGALEMLIPVIQAVTQAVAGAMKEMMGYLEKSGKGWGGFIAKYFDGNDIIAEQKRELDLNAKARALGMNGNDFGVRDLIKKVFEEPIGKLNAGAAKPGRQPGQGADPRNQVTLLGQGTESADASYRRLQDAINRTGKTEDPVVGQLLGVNRRLDKVIEQGGKGGVKAPPANGEK